MSEPATIEAVARALAGALGLGILEAAALAAIVFVAIRLSHPSATTRHVLWWIAFASSAVLPLVSVATSAARIEHRAAAAATMSAPSTAWHPLRAVTIPKSLAPMPRQVESPALPVPPPSLSDNLLAFGQAALARAIALPFAATFLIGLWFAVAAAGLIRLVRSLIVLRRVKHDALPLDESVVRRLRRLRHSTRAGRSVTLAVSNVVDVPVAVGFYTPTILLPIGVVENEEIADLDQISMHEYAHLDRYDDWTNLVQRVIERVLWFNPIVALMGRQISLEREIACDDWVIAQTGRAHRYATCLWKLVESARLPANPVMAPGALLSPKQITIRIEQLLDSRRNALPRLSPLAALLVGALSAAFVVVQAVKAPVIAVEDATAVPVRSAWTAPPVSTIRKTLPSAPARPVTPALPRSIASRAAMRPAVPVVPHVLALPVEPVPSPRPVAEARPRSIDVHVHVAPDPTPSSLARAISDGVAAATRGAAVNTTVEKTLRDLTVDQSLDINAHANAAATVALATALATVHAPGPKHVLAELGAKPSRADIDGCVGCDLSSKDLRGLDLHGVALTGSDLSEADLRGANLSGATLTGIDLSGALLAGADLRGAHLIGCDLHNTSFAGAKLDGLRIVGASVRGTNFSGTQLHSVIDQCTGCDLRSLDLHGQDLRGIKLVGADMRNADFSNANLSGVHFEAVDLRGANFRGANLENAVLHFCDLRDVDLRSANTHNADIDPHGSHRYYYEDWSDSH